MDLNIMNLISNSVHMQAYIQNYYNHRRKEFDYEKNNISITNVYYVYFSLFL